MSMKHMDRLGEILVSKRIITQHQLDAALKEQTHRREKHHSEAVYQSMALGEILIELGYINRLQLTRGLSWQSIVRTFAVTMALCAPFMAANAGAASSSSASSVKSATSVGSSSASSAASGTLIKTIEAENYTSMFGVQPEATLDVGGGKDVGWIHNGDWMSYSGVIVNIPTTDTYKITYRLASPTGGGSFALKESNSSATYDTVPVPSTGGFQTWADVVRVVTLPAGQHSFLITDMVRGSGFNINWFKIEAIPKPPPKSSASSSSVRAIITPKAVKGPVTLNWKVPAKRADTSVMDITELGGYQLRYKSGVASDFTYVTINDPWITTYYFPWLDGTYQFQIAVFDKDGLYSGFMDLAAN